MTLEGSIALRSPPGWGGARAAQGFPCVKEHRPHDHMGQVLLLVPVFRQGNRPRGRRAVKR